MTKEAIQRFDTNNDGKFDQKDFDSIRRKKLAANGGDYNKAYMDATAEYDLAQRTIQNGSQQLERELLLTMDPDWVKPVRGDGLVTVDGVTVAKVSEMPYGWGSRHHYLTGEPKIEGDSFSGVISMQQKISDIINESGPQAAVDYLAESLKGAGSDRKAFMTMVNDLGDVLFTKTDINDATGKVEGSLTSILKEAVKPFERDGGGVYGWGHIKNMKMGDISHFVGAIVEKSGQAKVSYVSGAQLFGKANIGGKPATDIAAFDFGGGEYGFFMGNESVYVNGQKGEKGSGVDSILDAYKVATRRWGPTGMHGITTMKKHGGEGFVADFSSDSIRYAKKGKNGVRHMLGGNQLKGYERIQRKTDAFVDNLNKKLRVLDFKLSSAPVVDLLSGENNVHNAEITLNLTNNKAVKVFIDGTKEYRSMEFLIDKVTTNTSSSVKVGYSDNFARETLGHDSESSEEVLLEGNHTSLSNNGTYFSVGARAVKSHIAGETTLFSRGGPSIAPDRRESYHNLLQLSGEAQLGRRNDDTLYYGTIGFDHKRADSQHVRYRTTEEGEQPKFTDSADMSTTKLHLGLGVKGEKYGFDYSAEFAWIGEMATSENWQYGQRGALAVRKRINIHNGNTEIEVSLGGAFTRVPGVMFEKGISVGVNGEFNKKGKFVPYFSVEGYRLFGDRLGEKINTAVLKVKAGFDFKYSENLTLNLEVEHSSKDVDPMITAGIKYTF